MMIDDNTDICPQCNEHCTAIDEDEMEYQFIVNQLELTNKL